ncbi:MAG: GYF domain-containing protein [Planctomycetota bacterium]
MVRRPAASSQAAHSTSPAASPARERPQPPLAAVEWRAASPDGEQLGPTVPTVFAQWIRSGTIEPDWLVWRSDWPDWRTAAEAAAELPAPLIGATPPAATAPGGAAAAVTEPAAAAASTVAAVAATIARKPAPDDYARKRRRSQRRQTAIATGLAAVAAGMLGVLVYLMLAG